MNLAEKLTRCEIALSDTTEATPMGGADLARQIGISMRYLAPALLRLHQAGRLGQRDKWPADRALPYRVYWLLTPDPDRVVVEKMTWGPEADARLLALRTAQHSLTDIANALGCSPRAAKARLDKLKAEGTAVPKVIYRGGRPRAAVEQGTTQRKCLCCGRPFNSEGPHNRMCGPCRTKSVSPYEIYA